MASWARGSGRVRREESWAARASAVSVRATTATLALGAQRPHPVEVAVAFRVVGLGDPGEPALGSRVVYADTDGTDNDYGPYNDAYKRKLFQAVVRLNNPAGRRER